MPAVPVPIDDGSGASSCKPCDLCCVLNSVAYGQCIKLFWQCNCPGGTLVLQRKQFSTWVDVADFPDSDNYHWPWDPYTLTGDTQAAGEYRLQCTLASGEVYYSNSVSIATVNYPYCECSEDGELKGYSVEVDYSITPYTASGAYPGTISWGTEVDYTFGINCQGGTTDPQRIYTFDEPTLQWAEAYLFYNGTPGGNLSCRVTVYTGSVFGTYSEARRTIASLEKGWRCHTACFSFNSFTLVPFDYYFCRARNGTPPNQYCSDGEKFRIKDIRTVTA